MRSRGGPTDADRLGPLGRVAAIAAVVAFTFCAHAGFRAVLDALS
ncbi:MAG TPA: hypothetical protein VHJ54_08245 [Solirubrobacterales bacterium]|nr:hypothetical protein [Solirubrobacterales bacterium]